MIYPRKRVSLLKSANDLKAKVFNLIFYLNPFDDMSGYSRFSIPFDGGWYLLNSVFIN